MGYEEHPFQVPEGAREVAAYLTYERSTLFLTLYDPTRYRGTAMNPSGKGRVTLDARCGIGQASPGIIAGTIEPGEWRASIDHPPYVGNVEYRLVVVCTLEPGGAATGAAGRGAELGGTDTPKTGTPGDEPYRNAGAGSLALPGDADALDRGPGWYRGELHAHTSESDGKAPAPEVAAGAEAAELDFFSLTDHHTVSGWAPLRGALRGRTLFIRGCEVTSRRGHANLHGISEPIDPMVDRLNWSMNDVADAVHEQGAIFCVNHAFSGILSWRHEQFDWTKADAMEILHAQEGPNNTYQMGLWDHLLRSGYHIVGVAGTDSHHPTEGSHRLGALVNWVHCDELTEQGVTAGVARGRVVASWGPFVDFTATAGGSTSARMWESIPLSAAQTAGITLRARVTEAAEHRLFLLRNGIPIHQTWLEPDELGIAHFHVELTPSGPCYFRAEVHTPYPDDESSPWKRLAWRDHRTIAAATNPIFVR
jgi:hypothetical protein